MRALCMLMVFYVHSEFILGYPTALATWIVPFCTPSFFFVSGYLYLRRPYSGAPVRPRRLAADVCFRLVIPTLLFSTLLFLPKQLFRHQDVSLAGYAADVLGGTTYWFTSALALVQLLTILLLACGVRSPWKFLAAGVVAFALRTWIAAPYDAMPWCYTSALTGCLYFALGGLYWRYEWQQGRAGLSAVCCGAALLFIAGILFQMRQGGFVSVSFSLLMTLLGCVALLAFSKLIPSVRLFHAVGRYSLLFYFLCGVLPAAVGSGFARLFPACPYWLVPLCFAVSVALALALSALQRRFAPALLDLRQR